MSFNIWDIFRYLYKWKIAIAAVVVLSFFAASNYVNSNQTFNAQIIIKYNDACISEGEAPDGNAFDSYEIVSPNVITDVIHELTLGYSVDNIRSRVTVEPLVPDSEKEIQASKEKNGEKYSYHPNTFSVTYKGTVGEASTTVRDVLDSIIKNYYEFYTEKYLELASISDLAYDEDMGNYDYIELAEIISDNLDNTITSLENYAEKDGKFRAASTGLTFSDLTTEYNHLNEFVVPQLFSDIYRGQISRDKQRLVEKYISIKEDYLLSQKNFIDQADVAKNRMDNFSEANKNVPNAYNSTTDSNNDQLAIIDNIDENKNKHRTTTTYDELITNYVTKCIAANDCVLKAEHCDDVISKFKTAFAEKIDVAELTNKVKQSITETEKTMLELNKTANRTIDDYNAYTATNHLSPLTGVQFYSTISLSLYALIAMMLGFAVSVLAVITIEILRAFKKSDSEKDDSDDEDNEDAPDSDEKELNTVKNKDEDELQSDTEMV